MVLDSKFNFGDELPQELVVQLDRMYQQIADEVNTKSGVVRSEAPPNDTDIGFPIGQLWVDEQADRVYIFTGSTAALGTWIELT